MFFNELMKKDIYCMAVMKNMIYTKIAILDNKKN